MNRATLTQVRHGRLGRLVEVSSDVMDICGRIGEIDPSLGVEWNDTGEYFRIYQLVQGRKHTVTNVLALTPELVEDLRRIAHDDYDLAGELDRLDDQADRNAQHRFREQVGELGEQLFHAARKDLQVQNQVILPRGV